MILEIKNADKPGKKKHVAPFSDSRSREPSVSNSTQKAPINLVLMDKPLLTHFIQHLKNELCMENMYNHVLLPSFPPSLKTIAFAYCVWWWRVAVDIF